MQFTKSRTLAPNDVPAGSTVSGWIFRRRDRWEEPGTEMEEVPVSSDGDKLLVAGSPFWGDVFATREDILFEAVQRLMNTHTKTF